MILPIALLRKPWMAAGFLVLGTTLTYAQVLNEHFNNVAGNGGTFFTGSGFGQTNDWDSALTGENAFAGTTGYASIGSAIARGLLTGGVNGSGGGQIQISSVTYNLLSQNFNAVTGTGGGAYLVGNGQPNTNGFTPNWDNGISREGAFGGTFGGAILPGGLTADGITTRGGRHTSRRRVH